MLGVRFNVPKGAYAVTAGEAVGRIMVAAAARGNVGKTGYGLNTGFKIGAEKAGDTGIKGLRENGVIPGLNTEAKREYGGKIWAEQGAV